VDAVLGIDISKRDFHASLIDGGKTANKSFPNSGVGFEQLSKWLQNRRVRRVHACMESTGPLGEALALFLFDHGHVVSVVNPSRIKAYRQSELIRTKTDAMDAAVIARFCLAQQPEAWQPQPSNIRRLQALLRRLEGLDQMRTQELNRLSLPDLDPSVEASCRAVVAALEAQIREIEREVADVFHDDPTLRNRRDLLTSIPGIGEKTAAKLLGEMPNLEQFRNVKAVAAFAGLSPEHRMSGTTNQRSRISKVGSPRLRKGLFLPALTAMRFNPALRAFADRLAARQKPRMVIVAAVMRKLLTLAYGVLKSNRPWDPRLAA
jgi:transposase